MTKQPDPDAYVAAAPDALRADLARLRDQLSRALPGSEEVMMYGMPGFQIGGALVAGYAAFTKSCGLYVDPGAIVDHADEISAQGLKATKTGVTFPPGRQITDQLVEKLAISSRRKMNV